VAVFAVAAGRTSHAIFTEIVGWLVTNEVARLSGKNSAPRLLHCAFAILLTARGCWSRATTFTRRCDLERGAVEDIQVFIPY